MEEAKKKILLVDDEPDITFIVEFVLSSAGFEITRLNDPREAVPELSKGGYSLLILDLMMPHMDGFDVLKKIREEKSLKKLSVIILSSRQLSSDETAELASGKAVMIAKPFEPHRLLEKVREILPE
jgi:DNA-binding response OmpR family regulator